MDNLFIIFEQFLLYLPLIFGAYCSMSLMKVPNLAIESAFVFGAILGSKSLYFSSAPISQLLIALILSASGGLLVGFVVSMITLKAKLSNLLSAIVTMGIFNGINLFVLGSSHLTISNCSLNILPVILSYPSLIALFLIVAIISILFFFILKTELGISFAIYGNNSKFFYRHKISTFFVFSAGLSLSNLLAGISGYLVSQTNGFVDITMGVGIALFCITTIMIGKTLFKLTSVVSILVPAIGLIVYFIFQQVLLKIGFDLRYFVAAQAFIILLLLMMMNNNKNNMNNQLGI